MALIAAILISISLLILTTAVSFEGFFSRYSILESNLKEQSVYLAEACMNTAILELSQDPDFADVGTIPVGTDQECQIVSVTVGTFPTYREIQTKAVSGEAVTNLFAEVDTDEVPHIEIRSWQEVANF